MVTPSTFSVLHRLPQDEVFHFYSGAPVEMLVIFENSEHQVVTLGSDLKMGHIPQYVVPAGSWQGARLASEDSSYALLGTTVSPGFEFPDMELKDRSDLEKLFPEKNDLIRRYTREV